MWSRKPIATRWADVNKGVRRPLTPIHAWSRRTSRVDGMARSSRWPHPSRMHKTTGLGVLIWGLRRVVLGLSICLQRPGEPVFLPQADNGRGGLRRAFC